MPDAEIAAISRVAEVLDDLEESARGRVLRWAVERYDLTLALAPVRRGKSDSGRGASSGLKDDFDDNSEEQVGDSGTGRKVFDTFAELYDAADPGTDQERVMVASYWTQFVKGKNPFGSRELNKELKDLGHAVTHINEAMSSNMKKKPALILQVSRGGGSPQSQKKYKVSEAGKKWVDSRLG